MQLQTITPMLWVNDVRATIDYYTSVLGFDEENYDESKGWGEVGKHFIKIMLSKPNAHTAFNGSQFTGSLYLRTDDVDAWWGFLKDRPNINIFYPIEDFDYGMREFAIKDNNGYILQFGSTI